MGTATQTRADDLSLTDAARYLSVHRTTLRRWMTKPMETPRHKLAEPLPHRLVGRRVLVSRRAIDRWMMQFRVPARGCWA